MTEPSPRVNRRRFVQGAIASTTLLGGVSSVGAQQSGSPSEYTLEQNGKCISLKPLSMSGLPIKQFYDYRTPKTQPSSFKYASFGSEKLQRKNTSILFLYKGPTGLSLVAVHDKVDAGSGGAVTFRITNLPPKGQFAIKDDSYNSSTNVDTWDYSMSRNWKGKKSASANISWAWDSGSSDGFVYRGLGKNFEFAIYPQFNQNAILSGETSGKIKQWEVLSGDLNNPVRTKLDMTNPITISSKSCGKKGTKQQSTQGTQKKKSEGGKKSSTTPKSPNTKDTNNEGTFFEQIWNSFASIIESVVSFFTSLF